MPRIDCPLPGLAAAGSSRIPSTVEAYLTTNIESLAHAEGGVLPPEQEALQTLYDEVQRKYAPPVLSGTQLYEQLSACRLLETGCEGIDSELLRGGIRGGQLVEICGESASGKTQLCLAAAAHAARSGLRVVYVDTSNALSGRRLGQVMQQQQQQAGQGADVLQDYFTRPLKFVEVRRCYDVHSLLRVLDELSQQAQQQAQQTQQKQQQQQAQQQQEGQGPQQQQQQQQQQQGDQQHAQAAAAPPSGVVRRRLEELAVGLLVVDCLSALITPILGGGQHNQGHALLAAVASSLKAFAAHSGAAVLVTNHMVGGSDDRRHEKRPAMGESWRNQPHIRIQLSRPPPGSASERCTATLRASALLPTGASAGYTIGDAGLLSDAQQLAGQQAQPMQGGRNPGTPLAQRTVLQDFPPSMQSMQH